MSSLDSLPLPPVIGVSSISRDDKKILVANDSIAPKKTLFLCSKPLSPKDKDIIEEYGKLVIWMDKYINVPLDQIPSFDYLAFDMNSKNARLTLGRTDLTVYNVVSYVSVIQKIEDFVEQVGGVAITSIPKEATSKEDFDNMLQNEKLISPSLLKSMGKWLIQCLKK